MRNTNFVPFLLLSALCPSCGETPAPETTAAPMFSIEQPVPPTVRQRCFLSVTTSDDGSITDSMVVALTFRGDQVTGRMDWLPGAKDKMMGTLEGKLKNDTISARYRYTAEGVSNVEERMLHLGADYVAVLTGDMVERDGGGWVLKDLSKAVEGLRVPEVPCR